MQNERERGRCTTFILCLRGLGNLGRSLGVKGQCVKASLKVLAKGAVDEAVTLHSRLACKCLRHDIHSSKKEGTKRNQAKWYVRLELEMNGLDIRKCAVSILMTRSKRYLKWVSLLSTPRIAEWWACFALSLMISSASGFKSSVSYVQNRKWERECQHSFLRVWRRPVDIEVDYN